MYCHYCGAPMPDVAQFCARCGLERVVVDFLPEAVPPVPAAPAAPTVSTPSTERHPFEFTGDGKEYFRIWIVNLLLSVVTLGIYSAWAKVRRLEYFYRHTRVAGAAFDYHGRPIAILKGRIIAVVLFGGYYAAGLLSPMLGLAAAAVLAAGLPWMMNRSLRFRLATSSYRGLRFHFHGSNRQAYWVFLGLPLFNALSLFALTPLWHQRLKRYQHANAAYGQTRFTFNAPVSAFYKAYAITFAGVLALAVASFIVLAVLSVGVVAGLPQQGTGQPFLPEMLIAGALAVYVVVAAGTWSLTMALIQNVVWRHTALGAHRFGSTLEAHKVFFIVITNLLGIVLTLGLYKPFADIRLTRYVVTELELTGPGALEGFVAAGGDEVSAFGEEAAEILDFDLAF
jgi:uncharacterized membrane protein YjgN (DUF898 family)